MSAVQEKQGQETMVVLKPAELEAMIRRVVREEISQALKTRPPNILDDWSQEGPDDPEGDELLAQEAEAIWEEYKDKPETWRKWEDVEAELDQLEVAGELPD